MSVTLASKVISPTTIQYNQLAQVTLSLTAIPDINANPVDIMLVLDRSGSMNGAPLIALKAAAIEFIDIIKEATNPGGTNLGSPNRIGVVSFAALATLTVPLTDNVAALTAGINGLSASGLTNHAAAFNLAAGNYTPVLSPPNRKILIMFTDGDTTIGAPAGPAAQAAKDAGIEIYCVGLGDVTDFIDNLNDWASDPTSSHVIVAPTPDELILAFQILAASIAKPGAVGIEVVDTVEDEFEILQPVSLTYPGTTISGYDIALDKKSITWTLDQLGVLTTEEASITFTIRYLGSVSAILPVNKSVVYTDESDPTNQVNFIGADAEIIVDCSPFIVPDCCEPIQEVPFAACDTVVDLNLPDETGYYDLKCNGRLLLLGVRLRNICPNRRIALGVIATEIVNGVEYSRGFKAMTIPAQLPTSTPCTSIFVRPITFVFPENLDGSPGLCSQRIFNVRVIAHYLDTGLTSFDICPIPVVPV